MNPKKVFFPSGSLHPPQMKVKWFLIPFPLIVGVLVALWPARPIVPLVESQDKIVYLRSEDGFIFDSVPIAHGASVTVARNNFQKTRPTIIFLHGFPDNIHSFSNQMTYFKDEFNVLSPSLRGYEPSSADSSGRLLVEELVKDVIAVLDFYKLTEPVHLVGHDWGSVIAQLACKVSNFYSFALLMVLHSGLSRARDHPHLDGSAAYEASSCGHATDSCATH